MLLKLGKEKTFWKVFLLETFLLYMTGAAQRSKKEIMNFLQHSVHSPSSLFFFIDIRLLMYPKITERYYQVKTGPMRQYIQVSAKYVELVFTSISTCSVSTALTRC